MFDLSLSERRCLTDLRLSFCLQYGTGAWSFLSSNFIYSALVSSIWEPKLTVSFCPSPLISNLYFSQHPALWLSSASQVNLGWQGVLQMPFCQWAKEPTQLAEGYDNLQCIKPAPKDLYLGKRKMEKWKMENLSHAERENTAPLEVRSPPRS